MAVTYCRRLYLHLSKYGKRHALPALGNQFQDFPSVAHYSTDEDPGRDNLSRAMKAYLEKSIKYDQFLKEQLMEYNLGKEFLANMMGRKSEQMTEQDVDDAINYLFPSALYVPKARPMMKPPHVLYSKQKPAVFDNTGRPFHFLFYTSKPNYSQCLHEAATTLTNLNKIEWKKETPPAPLILPVGRWNSKEELKNIFLEPLYDIEYEKFLEVFTKISEHKFAASAETFIKKYWVAEGNMESSGLPVTVVVEDNVKILKVTGLKRKKCTGTVTVKYPGTGNIRVNNLGIEYFHNMQCREQVSEPEAFI